MRCKLLISVLALVVLGLPVPVSAQDGASAVPGAVGRDLGTDLAAALEQEQAALADAQQQVGSLSDRAGTLQKTLEAVGDEYTQLVRSYGDAEDRPPALSLEDVARRVESLRDARRAAVGADLAAHEERARLRASIAETRALGERVGALIELSLENGSERAAAHVGHLGLVRDTLAQQTLALTKLDTCDSLRLQIDDRRAATIALLERENLLLRGHTAITVQALADGVADVAHLPRWVTRTLDAAMTAISSGRYTGGLVRWAGAALVLLLSLLAAARKVRRAFRAAPDLATDVDRAKDLGWRLLASLLSSLAIAVPFLLSAALIEGLPVAWRTVLRTFGLVALGLCFGRTLADRLLRSDGDWNPMEMDARSATLMRTGVLLLLWLTALVVPITTALTALEYQNAGALQALWTVYKVLAVVIMLLFVLRRGALHGLLGSETSRIGRAVYRIVTVVHPVLVVVGPVLLALDFLQYDLLAAFLLRIVGGVFLAGAAGVIAYSALWRGVSAWLQSVVSETPESTPETSRVEAATAIGRYVLLLLAIGGSVALLLLVQGADLGALHAFLDVELPFQGQVQGTRLTWFNVFAGLALMVLFLTAVPKLKLVLERFILPRTSLDSGLRYTISTLSGYVFAALGIYLGLIQIFDLGALGYVFAALSVGIGFGLQEIVSNFVSGLILLFERPIKVGDLITVGGTEGWVTKINIRATTIQTRDNVSMLIPNKDFITQAVVNSVYGDTIVRVSVSVGVAYGSDTELVHRLLRQASQEHPLVIQSRTTEITFDDFGASSLDFRLRCWIPHAREHVIVASDLRYRIDALFRENGIEIPFSQHDLHLRSIDDDAAARLRGS